MKTKIETTRVSLDVLKQLAGGGVGRKALGKQVLQLLDSGKDLARINVEELVPQKPKTKSNTPHLKNFAIAAGYDLKKMKWCPRHFKLAKEQGLSDDDALKQAMLPLGEFHKVTVKGGEPKRQTYCAPCASALVLEHNARNENPVNLENRINRLKKRLELQERIKAQLEGTTPEPAKVIVKKKSVKKQVVGNSHAN